MNDVDSLGEHKGFVVAVWALYLSGIFIPVLGPLVAVIISYVKRGESLTNAQKSHFDKCISLFWVSLVLVLIGWALTLVMGLGLVILVPVAIWVLVVCIKGLVQGLSDKAYS